MKIKRDYYLEQLIQKQDNKMVKVITGLRRVGKSYLIFELFYEYLIKNNVNKNNIIKINLDDLSNENLLEKHNLFNYIKSKIKNKSKYYVFIDEIQLVDGFSKVLNSLLHIENLDVYVTGSNSKFLSKDILTEFRGRGDQIHVYPLTFKEFMSVSDLDIYKGLSEYFMFGGLPYILTRKSDKEKIIYLENLFKETYLIDIIEKNKIEKSREFEDLLNVIASSISSLTNPLRLQKTFNSIIHSNISINTISQYIEFMEDAFLISKAQRYDIKGRKYIGTPHKYYFEDIGLRNARIGFRQQEDNHIMENIIYNELRYRGFSVDVGVVTSRKIKDSKQENKQYEIDFIANMGPNRYYIQSSFKMDSEEKINQEKNSFNNINDSFKKIFIVKDVTKIKKDENGFTTMSIYDFLLNENSLDF